jgi:UDP-N-acetylmuramoyl-tripeptide--D-alanyl-D-alanine ligase
MQFLLLFLLRFFSRLILRVHKPYIIGITGTVGKTTISHHISQFLIREFGKGTVMYSSFHYNGEFGLPLTIIGAKTGGRNIFLWFGVFVTAFQRLFQSYPKYLVLEYGIDHPWEMDYLLSIAVPSIAVMTEVMPNHIEQFGTFDAYRNEKLKFSHRSEYLIAHDSLREFIERDAIFYGRWAMSDIDASHIEIRPDGTEAMIHMHKESFPLFLPVFGEFQIDNILPIYAIADILNCPQDHIALYAREFQPDSWRSGILQWIGDSVIIDGSYNGGYTSIHAGIISMRSFLHSHRILFILGDMRELGNETERLHVQLAQEIINLFPVESNVAFYLVGPNMRQYVQPLLSQHFSSQSFLSSQEAGITVKSILLQKEDNSQTMIYAKGSQNTIFLEEAIKICLLRPEDALKLCRQSPEWMAKKILFFDSLR